MNYELHTIDTAPEESRKLLKSSQETFGMIPNLHAVMAESPAVLEAYQVLHGLFLDTDFDEEEQTVIWQTINIANNCHYCIPAHTAIAHMMKVNPEVIDALRNRTSLPNTKLQALHETTLSLLNNRGVLSQVELERFHDAGYENRHLLEIILGLSQKILSNYVNHQANTPVDEPFSKFI